MKGRGISIVVVLIGFLALSVSAAFVAMALEVNSTIDREYRSEIVAKNGLVARSAAKEAGTFLDSYVGALSVVASDPSADTIAAVGRAFPAFSVIYIADERGRVSASTGLDPSPGFDVSRQDSFRNASKEGGPVLSDSSISRTNYHTTAYISLRFSGGVAIGVLDLHFLSDYVRNIVLHEGYLVALADSQGTFVAHSDVERVDRSESLAWPPSLKESMTREGAPGREMDFEDGRYLVSAAQVPGKRWIAIAAEPISTIQGTITRVQRSVIAVLAAIMAIIVVVCSAAAIVTGRALRSITAGLHSIAKGDFGHAPPRMAISEFRMLADDFAVMAEAVRVREERLTNSIAQKELLLKEIHHRVKNNLQLVESLLSLESRRADPGSRASLGRAMERVDVLAAIHERLYQSEDLGELRFDLYLRSLAIGLAGAVRLSIETDEIVLEMNQAIPFGLIANELLTNAIKHAVASDSNPIRVRLTALGGGEGGGSARAELEIADGGPGFPPDFDPRTCDSLGIKLVLSLVDQIGGDWKLSPGPGARWRISFPVIASLRERLPSPPQA
jgi:two-component sensor histidine kinase